MGLLVLVRALYLLVLQVVLAASKETAKETAREKAKKELIAATSDRKSTPLAACCLENSYSQADAKKVAEFTKTKAGHCRTCLQKACATRETLLNLNVALQVRTAKDTGAGIEGVLLPTG